MKRKLLKEGSYLVFFLILSFFFFYKNIGFQETLQMDDTILWQNQQLQVEAYQSKPFTWWSQYSTTAFGQPILPGLPTVLLRMVDAKAYPQLSLILHIFMLGYFAFLFFRYLKLSTLAAIFGGIALMFTNDTISLILPGHLGNFHTVAYYPLVLLFLHKAIDDDELKYYLLSGAFLGIAFTGQEVQVSSYFAIFIGFYFLYLVLKRKGDTAFLTYIKENATNIAKHVGGFVALAVITLLFSLQTLLFLSQLSSTGSEDEKDVALPSAVKEMQALDTWKWATSWSLPPEETLDFIAPGVFGMYSGSRTHPYYGRMAKWPADPPFYWDMAKNRAMSDTNAMAHAREIPNWHGQGAYKRTGENAGYIAFIMIILALLVMRKREETFWGWAGLIILFLSFGRHFSEIFGALGSVAPEGMKPLFKWLTLNANPFRIIYSLPFMESFRNPNKFLHVFTIAFAVLSAFGFDYFLSLFKAKEEGELLTYAKENPSEWKRLKVFNTATYWLAGFALLGFAIFLVSKRSLLSSLTSDFGESAAALMTQNASVALIKFFFMTLIAAGFTSMILNLKKEVNLIEKIFPLIIFVIMLFFVLFNDLAPKRPEGGSTSEALALGFQTLFSKDGFIIILGLLGAAAYGVVLFLPDRPKLYFKAVPIALLFLLTFELWYTGVFFIQTKNTERIYSSNEVTTKLKGKPTEKVAFLSGGGVLNHFKTRLFPHKDFNINMLTPPAARQQRKDVKALFDGFRVNNPVGYQPLFYYLFGVRYLITDRPVPQYFPPSIVREFGTPVSVSLSKYLPEYFTPEQQQAQTIYLYEVFPDIKSPRVLDIVTNVVKASSYDEALETITAPGFNPALTAVVHDKASLAALKGKTFIGSTNTFELSKTSVHYGTVRVDVSNTYVSEDAILVLKDMYHPDWKVYVNNVEKTLLKVNGVFRGVYLPKGTDGKPFTVSFRYEPSLAPFIINIVCWMLLAIIPLVVFLVNRNKNKNNPKSVEEVIDGLRNDS